ncbi:MAG: glycosyltransferase family 4 protein [Gammaproteobacteria bacterium]|nr:glycosyltransferase family 4 protein [Gammaproteobacteria bacterium]
MKILLWSPYSFPHIGGMEVLLHTLALQLKAMGHEVKVLSSNMESDDCKEFEIDGIPIFLFPFIRALTHLNLPVVKNILNKVKMFINDFSPDIVNIHGWHELPAFYQVRALANSNIPLLLTIHGTLEQDDYKTPSCLRLMAMAHAVSAVSEALRRDFCSLGINSPPVQLIHNALIIPRAPIKPVDTQSQHIVMIGRLSVEKGFEIAFAAIKNLLPRYPQLRLTVVGDGPLINTLTALKRELGIEHAITMMGFVPHEEVFGYIDAAAFVLMPSSYESFGLVALETAMRGRAIIASNVVGLPEIIDHNTTGILIDPVNAETLQQAIDFLLQNPDKIREMGFAAKEKSKLFCVENMADQYEKIYNDIAIG